MATSLTDWQPVRIFGCGLQPTAGREYDCDPAWDVHAVYAEPDEVLPPPESGDGRLRPRAVFHDRHIDRCFSIDYPQSRRDAPRAVGWTIGQAERDWDVLVEHRDRYLGDAGLDLTSPPEAIARRFADSFKYASYFKDKPTCTTFAEDPRELCHPIEGLLHKSWCNGVTKAFCALADSAGLSARMIGLGGHIASEVLIDGRWRYVENSCRHERNPELEAFFPVGFLELSLNPDAWSELAPPPQRDRYWRAAGPQYDFMGGSWLSPLTLRLAAGCVAALYSELDRYTLTSDDGRRMPIILRANGLYWPVVHTEDAAEVAQLRSQTCPFPIGDGPPVADFFYHPFRPGDRLRQPVFLGDLGGLEALEITIPIAPEPGLDLDGDLGGRLTVRVGDFERSLGDLIAWPPSQPDDRGHRRCTVSLDPAILTADAANQVEFCNRSDVTMQTPLLPTAMEPHVRPLLRNA